MSLGQLLLDLTQLLEAPEQNRATIIALLEQNESLAEFEVARYLVARSMGRDLTTGIRSIDATGSIAIDATGLSAGTGTIELDGGTFTLGGSNRINDNTKLTVNGATIGGGAIIILPGTPVLGGAASDTSGGTLTLTGSTTGVVKRGIKCDPTATDSSNPGFFYRPQDFQSTGANPRRLRGTFAFVSLSTDPKSFTNEDVTTASALADFTAIALESGIVEGRIVHDFVRGGDGELDSVLAQGITWTFDELPQNPVIAGAGHQPRVDEQRWCLSR